MRCVSGGIGGKCYDCVADFKWSCLPCWMRGNCDDFSGGFLAEEFGVGGFVEAGAEIPAGGCQLCRDRCKDGEETYVSI